jgi:6-phosphogluconolactonase
MTGIRLEVLPDAATVALRGAAQIAVTILGSRDGPFALAASGGRTPWAMFGALARMALPWERVGIWQVDERLAPDGDPDRNLTSLEAVLPAGATLHPMPVTDPDPDAAARAYASGLPPAFDLVHLGLGDDGHTASLVPGDPVLDVEDRDVAVTGPYRGRRRMTLTYPALARARFVLWLVTGEDKAPVLPRLLARDRSIPAGRVAAPSQLVLADAAAAAAVGG